MEKIVDVETTIRFETEKAYLVDGFNYDKKGEPEKIWIPKSLSQDNKDGTISMPEWVAIEKDLI